MPITLNLIDTAIRSGTLQTFTRLLEGSRFEKMLRCEGPYTIFAPADIAFAYIEEETINRLLHAESNGVLPNTLSHHAVPGKILSKNLGAIARVKTLYGENLTICSRGELRIEGARLLHTDIEAQNGVIHTIDRLLLPAQISKSASSS